MKVEAFKPEHLEHVTPDVDALSFEETAQMAASSFAFTIKDNQDKIACIFGAFPLWRGVYEIWLLKNDEIFARRALGVYQVIQKLRLQFVTAMKPHRLQIAVRADMDRYCKFMEKLGFRPEGPMMKFGPNGEHFIRYAYLP